MNETWEQIKTVLYNVFIKGDYMALAFLFVLIFGFLLFVKLGRDNKRIDLLDIFLGPDEKVSITKLIQLGAFVITSWAFIYFAMQGKLSEWYFTAYMAAWAGSQLINKMIVNKNYIQEKRTEQ